MNVNEKGHRFAREVAAKMRSSMPGETGIKRGFQFRRRDRAADVECPHFWLECKRGRKPVVRRALQQAIDDAGHASDGRVPVAVIRDDREEPFVCLLFEDFLDLVGEWWQLRH